MKRFTIIFSILLALGFAGVLAYVAASPEFVPPAALVGEGEDPDAPIFDVADYGVVGNLFEVLPVLVDEIKKARS